jgi:acetyl-CoA acyltransferase
MPRQPGDAYIAAAVRTPVGKARGALATTRPDDLLAHVVRELLLKAPGLDPAAIGDVIVGCAIPEAEQGINVARIGALLAGLPQGVPAFTVNRFCASGLQAVALAADRIRLGEADVMIAAGTESMSLMPQIMGHRVAINPRLFVEDEHRAIAFGMGLTAERVAAQWQVTRADQDAFALASHRKALAAIAAGSFAAEIAPYAVRRYLPDAEGGVRIVEKILRNDEGPRADVSSAALEKLRPVFAAAGSVTAGNSSQMSDGAAAVLLVSAAALERFQLVPLARFAGYAVAGVAPEHMGIGPVAAIPKALERAGISIADLDWIELNEAFAAQALAVVRTLELDPAKVNPQGGAIALGHPLGATGAIRTATLVHALNRQHLKWGMVTMCIGTGMGAAAVFERV